MPVATFVQPNFTAQTAAAYKAALDAAIAVLATVGADYACHAKTVPDMQVQIDAGQLFLANSTLVSNAQQTSITIVAPVGNPRIDRIVINDQTGVVSVITGTPAASPVAPAIIAGTRPIAQILLQTSSTVITNSIITDERVVVTFDVAAYIRTLLDDVDATTARATLGSTTVGDAVFIAANAAAARNALVVPVFTALTLSGYGSIWSHGTDVTNDFNISAGGCMDATGAYWMSTASIIGKQADVVWAVGGTAGTPLGMLDTGAVANSDYYIWMIARSDTGVVDFLSSLSSIAPTMPTGYDFKRLRGWFKRAAGVNTLMDVYESEGGGVEVAWRAPTTDVSLGSTLTVARRTDAVKVPLNFSVIASMTILISDATLAYVRIMCPDETDASVSNATNNANINVQVVNVAVTSSMMIRTSAAGLIAARSDTATVDNYVILTNGFTWARRN